MPAEQEHSGPRYPFIPLRRALERARELWNKAGDHPIMVLDALQLWKYSPKASGGTQTVAALKYYGLLEEAGARGTHRRLKLTDAARRYFLDERPEKHAEAHKTFALQPRAMRLLWELWRDRPPADQIARSALKVDYGYGETAARELLAIYADNLAFANLSTSDRISSESAAIESLEGAFADLELGHEGDPVPMAYRSEPVAHRPMAASVAPPRAPLPPPDHPSGESFQILVYDERIRVTADVSLAEAKRLVKRLERRIALIEEEAAERNEGAAS